MPSTTCAGSAIQTESMRPFTMTLSQMRRAWWDFVWDWRCGQLDMLQSCKYVYSMLGRVAPQHSFQLL